MLCVVCKKDEAVVHYAEVIEGQIKKLDLCEKCAADKGVGMQVSFSMGDLLGGISETLDKQSSSATCPGCSLSLKEFRKGGRLGCPQCYEAFEDSLLPMIEQIHRSSQHKGKISSRFYKKVETKKRIKKIEQEFRAS